jgi:hypothetical protein
MLPYCQKANATPAAHRSQNTSSLFFGAFRIDPLRDRTQCHRLPDLDQPLMTINPDTTAQVASF